MSRIKLKTVSHRFEADMLKDMLKQIDVEVFISDHNNPEKMDVYLGQKPDGVELYVEENQLEDAKAFLEAQPEETTIEETVKPVMKFPYWIIGGFGIMLLIFMYYTYWQ